MQVFSTYYSYGVTSTISKKQDLPATFPAVTICNINPLNEAWANENIYNRSTYAKCFDFTNSTEFQACMGIKNTNVAFEFFNDQLKRLLASDKTLTAEDYYWYGYDLQSDMTISCQFNPV